METIQNLDKKSKLPARMLDLINKYVLAHGHAGCVKEAEKLVVELASYCSKVESQKATKPVQQIMVGRNTDPNQEVHMTVSQVKNEILTKIFCACINSTDIVEKKKELKKLIDSYWPSLYVDDAVMKLKKGDFDNVISDLRDLSPRRKIVLAGIKLVHACLWKKFYVGFGTASNRQTFRQAHDIIDALCLLFGVRVRDDKMRADQLDSPLVDADKQTLLDRFDYFSARFEISNSWNHVDIRIHQYQDCVKLLDKFCVVLSLGSRVFLEDDLFKMECAAGNTEEQAEAQTGLVENDQAVPGLPRTTLSSRHMCVGVGEKSIAKARDVISDKNRVEDIELYFNSIVVDKLDSKTALSLLSGAVSDQPMYIVQEIFVRIPSEKLKMTMNQKLGLLERGLRAKKTETVRFLVAQFEIDAKSMNDSPIKWGTLSAYDVDLCQELIERFDLSRVCFATLDDVLKIDDTHILKWIVHRFGFDITKESLNSKVVYELVALSLRHATPAIFAEHIAVVASVVNDAFKKEYLGSEIDKANLLKDCFDAGKMEQFDALVKHFQVDQYTLTCLAKRIIANIPVHSLNFDVFVKHFTLTSSS